MNRSSPYQTLIHYLNLDLTAIYRYQATFLFCQKSVQF